MKYRPALALIGASLLALPAASRSHLDEPDYWRILIKPLDHSRLRQWRDAFLLGLSQAREAGFGDKIAAEGILLDPDAAQEAPEVPDGDYRCRTVKLGHPVQMMLNRGYGTTSTVGPNVVSPPTGPAFSIGGSFTCHIGGRRFTEVDGPQRPAGRLWAYDATRLIFLGAIALGDESQALDYGRDDDRDMVGFIERIGTARWRLVLPKPHWQSQIEVIELVPKAG